LRIFLYERCGPLWLTGDEKIPASMVTGAGLSRSCSHCTFGDAEAGFSPGGVREVRAGLRSVFLPDGGRCPSGRLFLVGAGSGRDRGDALGARAVSHNNRDWQKTAVAGCAAGMAKTVESPTPLTTPTWNPLQHPKKHTTPRNRHAPAPITIEAGIHSSPVSRSGTRRTDKKISDLRRNQTPNHPSHQPAAQSSAACKKRFCLLFRRL